MNISLSSFILAAAAVLSSASFAAGEARRGAGRRGKLDLGQEQDNATKASRAGKLFPIFQIVTFPNDVCQGSGTRNGTCYTTEECSNRGGSSSGDCASGFGVCCIFILGCGGMSSENCTFIVQSTSTSVNNPCTYTICPCSTNICRIRLDFNTFNIAGPQTGQASDAGTQLSTNVGAIGDCTTDTFSLSAPGNRGSPVICGFNTGQHMIVDASSACHIANFGIGSSSGTSRSWDIKVTQYGCGESVVSGPDGCLQYFTGTTGTVSSFNFPTTSSTVGSTTTHLSSQCYTMCFRREVNFCAICFTTAITNSLGDNAPDTETTQSSFGLSISADNAAAQQQQAIACTSDYLIIPNFEAGPVTVGTIPASNDRICGRTLNAVTADNIVTGASVCTQVRPFQITFKADADEVGTSTLASMGTTNEQSVAPSGIIGFSLNYVQQAC